MNVTARITQQGIHHWPEAPDNRGYLRFPHRHLFGIAAQVAVDGDGRDVEFHDLADSLEVALATLGTAYHPDSLAVDFGDRSCENMAAGLAEALEVAGYDVLAVTVSEDWENDATWIAEED